MKLLSLHVRRFRSIRAASLSDCGPMNVLIGKNNAGKSNLLEAIEILFSHLQRGSIATDWNAPRPIDEFVDATPRLLSKSVPNYSSRMNSTRSCELA